MTPSTPPDLRLFPWHPVKLIDYEEPGKIPPPQAVVVNPDRALLVDLDVEPWLQQLLSYALAYSPFAKQIFTPHNGSDRLPDSYFRIPRLTAARLTAILPGQAPQDPTTVPIPQDERPLVADSITFDLDFHAHAADNYSLALPCRLAFAGNVRDFADDLSEIAPVFNRSQPWPTLRDLSDISCMSFLRYDSEWSTDSLETQATDFCREAIARSLRWLEDSPTADPTRHNILYREILGSLEWLLPTRATFLIGLQGADLSLNLMPLPEASRARTSHPFQT